MLRDSTAVVASWRRCLVAGLSSRRAVFDSRPVHIGMGAAVAQWLRRWATNRKVAGSIPDGIIGIFH